MKSIYVGNLPYSVTEIQLQSLFAQYGDVLSVKLVTDRDSGRSKGYGFIEMDDNNSNNAIGALNSTEYQGRIIKVSEAKTISGDKNRRVNNNMNSNGNKRYGTR